MRGRTLHKLNESICLICLSSVFISIVLMDIWYNAYILAIIGFGMINFLYILNLFFLTKIIRKDRINKWFALNPYYLPLININNIIIPTISFLIILLVYSLYKEINLLIFGCVFLIILCSFIIVINLYNYKNAKNNNFKAYIILLNKDNILQNLEEKFEPYRIHKQNIYWLKPTHIIGRVKIRIVYSLITIFIIIGGDKKDIKRLKQEISKIADLEIKKI